MRMPQSACHGHRRRGSAKPSLVVVLLTVLALVGSGCTSLHPVHVAAPGASPTKATVKPGDVVRVTMDDGRTAQFTVWRVDPSAITAIGGASYATNEIATLERRSVNVIGTSALSALVAVGLMVLIVGIVGLSGVAAGANLGG